MLNKAIIITKKNKIFIKKKDNFLIVDLSSCSNLGLANLDIKTSLALFGFSYK